MPGGGNTGIKWLPLHYCDKYQLKYEMVNKHKTRAMKRLVDLLSYTIYIPVSRRE